MMQNSTDPRARIRFLKSVDKWVRNRLALWSRGIEDRVVLSRTSASEIDVSIKFAKTIPLANHSGTTGFVVPRSAEGLSIGQSDRLGVESIGFKLTIATLDKVPGNIARCALSSAARAVGSAHFQCGKAINELKALAFMFADLVTILADTRAIAVNAIKSRAISGSHKCGAYADMAKQVAITAVRVFGDNGLARSSCWEPHPRLRSVYVYRKVKPIPEMDHLARNCA